MTVDKDSGVLYVVVTALIFLLGSFVTSIFFARQEVVYQGVLEFADSSTLQFQDGTVFTCKFPPLFLNSTETLNSSTHYNCPWVRENETKPLISGHTYQIVEGYTYVLWIWKTKSAWDYFTKVREVELS